MWQIKAFGLNRLDLSQREGRYPLPPGASSILGVEFAGVVTELGPGVTEWSVGDEVLGLTTGVSMSIYWCHVHGVTCPARRVHTRNTYPVRRRT